MYRKQAEAHNDREATFSYYECVDGHDDCPVCGKFVGRNEFFNNALRLKRCYPEKRITIKGFWWWAKRCPLGGVHDHYRCRECNTIWVCFHIRRQPSPKVHV
jgi:hypothetical protein